MLQLLFALIAAAVPSPLSGPWTVHVGRSATGAGSRSVELPYVANAIRFTGRHGLVSYRGNIAWYRKRFKVPGDGPYVIRFESVHHKATVWIDGVPPRWAGL